MIGEQTCARHVKYSVIRVIFSFSGGVLRSRDTHTRNGAKEEGKNITHTHMTAPSEVFYFLRALLSLVHNVCNPPNERGGRAARRLSSDGWVTTCNLR